MTIGAYAMIRALEKASTRWLLVSAGASSGFAFLTKMLQAFLVLPGFVVMYLVAAPTRAAPPLRPAVRGPRRAARVGRLVGRGGSAVAGQSRPYVGGSQNNSVLDLLFGYNGFGRLTGDETGSVDAAVAARSSAACGGRPG